MFSHAAFWTADIRAEQAEIYKAYCIKCIRRTFKSMAPKQRAVLFYPDL